MMFGHMGGFGNGFRGYGPGGYGGYGMMYGDSFTGILLLILIGVVIFLLVKRNQPSVNQPKVRKDTADHEALEIAKLRYVRGEITFEEYQEIIKVING